MIAAVLRRSCLASGRTLSASLSTFDSGLHHHLTPAATGVSTKLHNLAGNGSEGFCNISCQAPLASSRNSFGIRGRDFHIRSEPSMVFPAGIAVQGYATASESIEKSKHTSENVKALSRKEIAKLSSIQKEAEGRERASKIKGTKICIAIRSFDNLEKQSWSFPPHTRKVAMPDTRVLYTVLRSPHVDKKSREQFEMRCKKRFLIIKAQSHELNKKLFWLKRQRILGAQYEVQFHCKTRLDMASCFQNIDSFTK